MILRSDKSLQVLDVSRNEIEDDGLVALADALQTNGTLNLSDNDRIRGFGVVGATALGSASRVNVALQHLVLAGNWIGDCGIAALAIGVKVNHSLRTLSLADNKMHDSSAIALADALAVNSALICVSLNNNQIVSAGGIAASRRHAASSREPHKNDLGDAVAPSFAAALCVNTTLRVLELAEYGDPHVAEGFDGGLNVVLISKADRLHMARYFISEASLMSRAAAARLSLSQVAVVADAMLQREPLGQLGPAPIVRHICDLACDRM